MFCRILRDLPPRTRDDPWAPVEFCEMPTCAWGAGGVPRPPAAKLYAYRPVRGKPCPLHTLVCERWISFPYLLPSRNLLEKLRQTHKSVLLLFNFAAAAENIRVFKPRTGTLDTY